MPTMKSTRSLLFSLLTLGLLLAFTGTLQAQEVPFEGVINQNDVTLRAGAGTPYYIVGKAAKGTRVTVAERIADWYKITPPPGVYSYVSKAFVDVRGDGSTGTVRQRLSVYAASINGPGESYRRQHELLTGDTVKIVGEEGSYFKIEPPKDSYVYVQTQYIDVAPAAAPGSKTPAQTTPPTATPAPVTPQPAAETPRTAQPAQTPQARESNAPTASVNTPEATPRTDSTPTPAPTPEVESTPAQTPATPAAPAPATPDTTAVTPQTAPALESTASNTPPVTPKTDDASAATQPTPPAAAQTADQTPPPQHPLVVSPHLLTVEQQFYKAMELPIEKQPLEALRGRYQALENDPTLTLGDQRVLMARLAQIDRNIALARAINNLDEVRKELKPSTTILKAPVDKNPDRFDAVGLLLASSVYDGKTLPRLYRLVSAGDGRTIAYLRPTGSFDAARALGSTVGVIGQTRYDTALKLRVIDAKELVVLSATTEE